MNDAGRAAESVTARPSDGGGDGVAAAALDQSHDLIVVLDDAGTIVLTNAAWRAGADRRGGSAAATGCGANYLEACERSDAAAVAAGIRAVLLGDRPRFEFDYPCHSPAEDAWYALEVSALTELGSGAVVMHTNITPRIATDRLPGLGRDLDPVTMLATSPAGVAGLAQMLADAQARESSLAVVTITLSDLVEIESRHGRRCRDDLIVHTVARVFRLTRADDVLIRPSTNELMLFASVADSRGARFLRDNIARALEAVHLVGAIDVESPVNVDVVSSDQFSTLNSLLHRFATEPARAPQEAAHDVFSDVGSDDDATDPDDALQVPMAVYSLPDGYLQAANEAARSLFGFGAPGSRRLHSRDIVESKDLRLTSMALSALGSGATDSYRAQRTLRTADGPLALMTSVRRLLTGSGALAVVLTVPADVEEVSTTATDDPFAVALVAGTIDADGAITSVSAPSSPMEADLTAALTGTLGQAAHPDERDLVDKMLESMRRRGSASDAFRLPSEQGWVVCRCQLFTIKRPIGDDAGAARRVAEGDSYAFVLSASISTSSMIDKIARLERHIRRIGSEVHAADVDLTVRPTVDRSVSAALDALQLTARQRDIVERLAQGQRVASIAAALYVSRSTVRNHLAHVYQMVGVHSQEELLNALKAS